MQVLHSEESRRQSRNIVHRDGRDGLTSAYVAKLVPTIHWGSLALQQPQPTWLYKPYSLLEI